MAYVNISEIGLDDAVRAFKRYRWLALEELDEGRFNRALDRLDTASKLRARIYELGGKVPF